MTVSPELKRWWDIWLPHTRRIPNAAWDQLDAAIRADERAKCGEDTKRIDWIQRQFSPMELDVFHIPEDPRAFLTLAAAVEPTEKNPDGDLRLSAPTVRDVIDLAMKRDSE